MPENAENGTQTQKRVPIPEAHRIEMKASGLTAEQIKTRLNAHVAESSEGRRRGALRSAVRYAKWLETDANIVEFSEAEKITRQGMAATIMRMSAVALDAAYDEVIHTEGDLIYKALVNPEIMEKVVPTRQFLEASDEQAAATPQATMAASVSLPMPRVRTSIQPSPLYEETIPEVSDSDNPLSWQADSLCAQTDPEMFFPEKGGSTKMAKKVCADCDVRVECLEYALENEQRFGIWGGKSERERRKILKQTQKSA